MNSHVTSPVRPSRAPALPDRPSRPCCIVLRERRRRPRGRRDQDHEEGGNHEEGRHHQERHGDHEVEGRQQEAVRPQRSAPKPASPFLWESQSPDASLPSVGSFEAATTAIVPNNKLFKLLIIGSDARANENMTRTRGDSIHIFVWNPAFNKGILVGIPRDSYITLKPSNKKGKITGALSAGGPEACWPP